MDEPGQGTAPYTVAVCATATGTDGLDSVNDLGRAILQARRAAGRQLYVQAFAALQEAWLGQRQGVFLPLDRHPARLLAGVGLRAIAQRPPPGGTAESPGAPRPFHECPGAHQRSGFDLA